jgi:type IV fimbrial biogenesis protein FimT
MRMSQATEPAANPHMRGDRRHARGFTLIELAIALVVIAVLFALGVPSFKAWMLNSQIRDAADAVLNGIQVARANAIQRNLLVVFTLTPQAGTTPASWSVDLDNGTANIQSWSGAEGAAQTTIATNNNNTKVTFNGMGQRVSNSDASGMLTQVDITSSTSTAADVRPLRVVVGTAGSAKMCDPSLATTDPRAC